MQTYDVEVAKNVSGVFVLTLMCLHSVLAKQQ